jgi:Zn-finger nucleic acid-binding protein
MKPLEARVADELVVMQRCPSCQGVLLEADALRELGPPFALAKAEGFAGTLRCPCCEAQMDQLPIKPAKSGLFQLVVDKCGACEATFFEFGHLERASGKPTRLATQRPSARMTDDELLSELLEALGGAFD